MKACLIKRPTLIRAYLIICCILVLNGCSTWKESEPISPNQFQGTDIQRIQSAINAAEGTINKVIIPFENSNGTNFWLLDSAIIIPGNMTIILDNCTIQLSDQCRDNMFRSKNAGIGITEPEWITNIKIIGMGDVLLKGAKNPRSTGDSGRTLVSESQKGRVSYGSDAGKEGIKQTGDWRNIMILMAYVNGFTLRNVNIENAHAWAVSFERTLNASISDIRFNSPEQQVIDGKEVFIANRDGINLRHGCKNFRIDNISGRTGDDFIAMSILGLHSENLEGGGLNSTMVTGRRWRGKEDDIEQVHITNINCQSKCRAIAIRANDSAGISNVYISGLIYRGPYNSMLLGGKGYGRPSLPGRINNVHLMNVMGDGNSLVLIEEAVANCSFLNGMYSGEGEIIKYNIDKSETRNIISQNLIKISN